MPSLNIRCTSREFRNSSARTSRSAKRLKSIVHFPFDSDAEQLEFPTPTADTEGHSQRVVAVNSAAPPIKQETITNIAENED
jgi:hypothetical protein